MAIGMSLAAYRAHQSTDRKLNVLGLNLGITAALLVASGLRMALWPGGLWHLVAPGVGRSLDTAGDRADDAGSSETLPPDRVTEPAR